MTKPMSSLASSKAVLAAVEACRGILKESALENCDIITRGAWAAAYDCRPSEMYRLMGCRERTADRLLANELAMIDLQNFYKRRITAKERKSRRKNKARRMRRRTQGSNARMNELLETWPEEESILSGEAPSNHENAWLDDFLFIERVRSLCLLAVLRAQEGKKFLQSLGVERHPGLDRALVPITLFLQMGYSSAQDTSEVAFELRDKLSGYYGVLLLAVGFVFLFFGGKLLKFAFASSTFVLASCSSFLLLADIFELSLLVCSLASCILGLIASFVSLKLWSVSLFSIGALLGISVWLMLRPALGQTSEDILYSVCAGLMVGGGLIAVQLEKIWIRVSAPLIGAIFVLQGLGNLFAFPFDAAKYFQREYSCDHKLCWVSYLLLALLPVLGYLYQFWHRRSRKRVLRPPEIPIEEPISPNG